MMNEFSISIRKYSQYSHWESAPQGFKSPKTPIMVDKWRHFPMRENLLFKIGSKRSGMVSLIISWNNLQILEEVNTELHCDIVQFSFKAPSISCKYLFNQNGQTFIRRFQIGFHTGHEFLQTKEVLAKLGFSMRNAVCMGQNTAMGFNNVQGTGFDYNECFPGMYSQVENFNWSQQPLNMMLWNNPERFILSQGTPLPLDESAGVGKRNGKSKTTHVESKPASIKKTGSSSTESNTVNVLNAIEKEYLEAKLNDKIFMQWVCMLKLLGLRNIILTGD